MKIYYILILVLILFFQCSTKEQNYSDILALNFKENTFDLSVAEITHLIKLETTENNFIGDISQIEMVEDRIFIVDPLKTSTLQVYDTSGKYIGNVGQKGNGPEEFQTPSGFIINTEERQICIVDKVRNTFLFYDLDSYHFLYRKKIPFNFAHCLPFSNGEYVWFDSSGFMNEKEKQAYHFLITDSLFNKQAYFHPVEFTSEYWLGSGENIYEVNNRIFGYSEFDNIVYEITAKDLVPYYEISFNSSRLPTVEELKVLSDNGTMDYSRKLFGSDWVSLYSVYETPSSLFLQCYINNQSYLGLYNKKTGQIGSFSSKEFDKDWRGLLPPPCGVYNDSFIFYISPSRLKRGFPNRPELKELKEKCDEEDNPIICLINFTPE